MTQRIVITGPESSGKTTLCRGLANHYSAPCTPEYAREYLSELRRPYREEDLLHIAQQQWQQQQMVTDSLVFCDTGLVVILIWSIVRYEQVHPWVVEKLRREPAALYLLSQPDIPWEPDPLRENPNDREALFTLYRQHLDDLQLPYRIVQGPQVRDRLMQAIAAVEEIRTQQI